MSESPYQARTVDAHRPFKVGDWLVEPDSGRLIHDGRSIKLEPKVMDLLVYLVQRPGRVLPREELEQAIWAGTVVGYDALTSAIIKLRKAFGDDPHHPWLIETVAKKGYRLIAPVTAADSASPATMPGPFVRNRRLLGVAALTATALVGLAIGWFALDRLGLGTTRIPSIAVLPFTNLGGDPKLAYFSDGVREDIITDLSKLSGLRVIARNPAFASQDQPLAIKGVAEALGARYVLEGSVRRAGDDIRITAKLIDTETGSHLWAEGYNRRMRDIFAVQVDVTRNIVTALALTLTDEEKEYVARRDTRSVEAYDLFLQGQARYVRNLREDNFNARDYFLRALALDDSFTRAHGALALTHADDFRFAWSNDPVASADAALRHAERAVALDARSPQAHWVLGYILLHVRKDHASALKLGERAIALDPNHADAHALLALSQVYAGDTETAVRHIERAMLLSPDHTARYRTVLGFAHYFAGRYDKARAALEQALEQNPTRLLPQLYLAATLSRLGKLDEARWLADTIHTEHPEFKLRAWADTQPFVDRTRLDGIVDDLRRAGLD
jgi:TolB-like protein/DNA-binding winged helix-turn-helix (wHTH) protein